MATLLNDKEIKRLLGCVIVDGDPSCVRPNSYILRLGGTGEFLNAGKEFTLGKTKKGLKIQPGHSVALTAFETLDFRRDTVHKLYPDHDLHAIISPNTDLSREGIVAPTTQVDAGYFGTLNWTVSNTSSEERRFVFKERLFRLTILKLGPGETPEKPYEGSYQAQTGYIRSNRTGAPVGMRSEEWVDSNVDGGPEQLLENLIKSGYPWHVLGQRFKIIDEQFKTVTNEYAEIQDSICGLTKDVEAIKQQNESAVNNLLPMVRAVVQEQGNELQNRWLLAVGSLLGALIGIGLTISSNDHALAFIKNYGCWVGLFLIILAAVTMVVITRRRSTPVDRTHRNSNICS